MRNFTKRIVIAALVALTSAISLESSQVRLAEVQAYQGEVVPVPKAAQPESSVPEELADEDEDFQFLGDVEAEHGLNEASSAFWDDENGLDEMDDLQHAGPHHNHCHHCHNHGGGCKDNCLKLRGDCKAPNLPPLTFQNCTDVDDRGCISSNFTDEFCLCGQTQQRLPNADILTETLTHSDAEFATKQKTCACGKITKTFTLSGCIKVTEDIDKEICDGNHSKTDGEASKVTESRKCCHGDCDCDLECHCGPHPPVVG